MRITTADIADVALEMLNIDGIESNDGGEQTHVGFRQLITKVVWSAIFGKLGFRPIERLEQSRDILLICFLRAETR